MHISQVARALAFIRCVSLHYYFKVCTHNISTGIYYIPTKELTCTASANKSTPFNMAARPSTPNRISFPVAMPRRATTLDRVDWMADWRRLREALFSVFIIALPIYVYDVIYCSVYCLDGSRCYRRIDAGVSEKNGRLRGWEIQITTGLGFGQFYA